MVTVLLLLLGMPELHLRMEITLLYKFKKPPVETVKLYSRTRGYTLQGETSTSHTHIFFFYRVLRSSFGIYHACKCHVNFKYCFSCQSITQPLAILTYSS